MGAHRRVLYCLVRIMIIMTTRGEVAEATGTG